MKLSCVKCEFEMRVRKNGVYVLELDEDVNSDKLWSADVWYCPVCEFEIVCGFGNSPVYQVGVTEEFSKKITDLINNGKRVILSHCTFRGLRNVSPEGG